MVQLDSDASPDALPDGLSTALWGAAKRWELSTVGGEWVCRVAAVVAANYAAWPRRLTRATGTVPHSRSFPRSGPTPFTWSRIRSGTRGRGSQRSVV
jgi:hypothetical protein